MLNPSEKKISLQNSFLRFFLSACLIFSDIAAIPSVAWFLISSMPAQAEAASRVMNFQGRLTNTSNNPQTGSFDFKFRLFDAPSGGNQLWPTGGVTEDQTLPVSNGVFSAQVGSVTPIPLSAFQVADGTDVYLEIQVQGETLSPRQKMLAVPYAMTLMGRTTAHFVSTGAVTQSIAGDKTFTGDASFSGTITVPAPASAGHAVTKAYVDSLTGGGSSAAVLVATQAFSGQNSFTKLVTVSSTVVITGNVGIGTATPKAQLSLGQNVGNTKLAIFEDGTNFYGFGIQANEFRFHGYSASADFRFYDAPAGNALFTIKGAGNVGIGTSTPAGKFHVRYAANYNLVLHPGPTVTNSMGIQAMNDAGNANVPLEIRSSLTAFTAGNVGIGTVSPGYALDVIGAAGTNAIGRVATLSGVGGGYLLFGNIAGGVGEWQGDTSGNVLLNHNGIAAGVLASYRSGAVANTLVMNSGNVGVGTAAPASKLHVNGNIQVGIAAVTDGSLHSPGQLYLNMDSNNDDAGTSNIIFGTNRALGSGGSELMRLTEAGNLGLGTTSSGSRLTFIDVNQTSNGEGLTWYSPSPTTYGIFRTAGAWSAPSYQQLKLAWDTGIVLSPGGSGDKNYVDIQGGGLRVTSGNVGIATTAPGARLVVVKEDSGTGAVATFYPSNLTQGTRITYRGVETLSGTMFLDAFTNQHIFMQTQGTGYVGIGTTAPVEKLDVIGNVRAAGILVDGNISSTNQGISINYNAIWKSPSAADNNLYLQYHCDGCPVVVGNGSGAGESLVVYGALSKTSGSFDIPHPSPEKNARGVRLRHYFVETPSSGDNIYRWRIEVKNGEGRIPLRDYFGYLNENIQVWVSPDEHFGTGYGKVNAGMTEVVVKASKDGWYHVLAVGTRKDPLAQSDYEKYGIEYHKEGKNVVKEYPANE